MGTVYQSHPAHDHLVRSASGGRAGDCLAGGGAAGELMRSIDWARTPIGPVASWSPALRSTLALLLHNHTPLLLWWGPEFLAHADSCRWVTASNAYEIRECSLPTAKP